MAYLSSWALTYRSQPLTAIPPLEACQGEIEADVIFDRLFRRKPAQIAGLALYNACVDQARLPVFYEAFGVPDTVEGRFEIYTLHVFLVLHRLKQQGARATDTAQGLFDTYLSSLDDALREMGVGDLSVGKKMRKLGEAFYGRVKNYDAAFKSLPDITELETLLQRTVYGGAVSNGLSSLTGYVLHQVESLNATPLDMLLEGQVSWRPL